MSRLQERSEIWYKLRHNQPVPLTVTMQGTGSAVANMYRNEIIIDCTDAEVDKYVNISTPMAFEVIDVHIIHEDATQTAVQVVNTGDAVTNAIAIAASDKDLDIVTTIDNNVFSIFQRGDDDLRLEITTAAFVGKVIISIEPVVS